MPTEIQVVYKSPPYASKSTCLRGAKRAGHGEEALNVEKDDDGWVYYVLKEIEVADKPKRVPSYKLMYNTNKSAIDNPVKFIHDFLNAHPDLKRKQAIFELTSRGINFSTARTQYQRWYSERKGE
jgi:hypothetical protein